VVIWELGIRMACSGDLGAWNKNLPVVVTWDLSFLQWKAENIQAILNKIYNLFICASDSHLHVDYSAEIILHDQSLESFYMILWQYGNLESSMSTHVWLQFGECEWRWWVWLLIYDSFVEYETVIIFHIDCW